MNKEKIKNWFKDRDNLILVGILVFALIIRLYYFFLTKNQPLWWDEADYMAYAKTLAGVGETSWIVTSQHNSILSWIAALLFIFKFPEYLIKFILEIVPSVGVVLLTYLITKSMYLNKKIALISSFIMAVFWNILFNSTRFHVDVPALFFAFLAVYCFFEGYERKENIFFKIKPKWAVLLAIIFTTISYAIRRNYAFFGIFFMIYLILTKKPLKIIKNKYNWIGIGAGLILFILIEIIIFNSPLTNVAGEYYHPENSFNWKHLNAFSLFFFEGNLVKSVFLLFTYLGLLLTVFNLFISYPLFKKEEMNDSKSDLFVTICLIFSMAYFIFFQRGTTIGEPRWYYPILLTAIIFSSKGILYIYGILKKYNKSLAIFLILVLIAYAGYSQIIHADQIIKAKIPSYNGIKEGGTYLKDISLKGEKIISVPVPQTAYYSEKKVIHPNELYNKTGNESEEIKEFITNIKEDEMIRYLIVSFSEPNHPSWLRKENEEYAYNSARQIVRTKLEIPLMNTKINFQTGEQKIQKENNYDKITFRLMEIKEDCFVYEILRNSPQNQ